MDIKLLSKNKYLKVPLFYSGTGGFDKYWKLVSYISNDNLTYANFILKALDNIVIYCNNITNGYILGNRTNDNFKLDIHVNANDKIVYEGYDERYLHEFSFNINDIETIKIIRTDAKHANCIINNTENYNAVVSRYQVWQDGLINIYKAVGNSNISNYNITKIEHFDHENDIIHEYFPAICIEAYDEISLDTVAFVDFENELVIKAVSGNFVANE